MEDVSGRERAFGAMKEKDLQSAVLNVLDWMGWLMYHTFDSRRSQPGFPDLVAVRGSRIMFVEFKAEKGKVSDAQEEWLTTLAHAHDEVYVVRPSTEEAFYQNVRVLGSNLTTHWRNQRDEAT